MQISLVRKYEFHESEKTIDIQIPLLILLNSIDSFNSKQSP